MHDVTGRILTAMSAADGVWVAGPGYGAKSLSKAMKMGEKAISSLCSALEASGHLRAQGVGWMPCHDGIELQDWQNANPLEYRLAYTAGKREYERSQRVLRVLSGVKWR